MELPNIEPELRESLGARTMMTFKRISKILHQSMAIAGLDITMQQFGMMTMIKHNAEISQQSIACAFNLNKSSVMRMIDNLEKKGLVRRVPDPKDRRINMLEITDAGEAIREQVIAFHVDYRPKMEKGITEEERKTYLRVLKKLRANSESIEETLSC